MKAEVQKMGPFKRFVEWFLTSSKNGDQPQRSMFGADDRALEEREKENEFELMQERHRGTRGV